MAGRICLRGNKVCFENGVVHVTFKRKKHKIATVAKACAAVA